MSPVCEALAVILFVNIGFHPWRVKSVNGNFTLWGVWGDCTKTCGGGSQERMRNCTNPPSANGGANCTGPSREFQSCNDQPCSGHCSLSAREGTITFEPYKKPACSLWRYNGDGRRLSLELTNFDVDCSCYQFVIKENVDHPNYDNITKYCGRAERISFLAKRAVGLDEFKLDRFCNDTNKRASLKLTHKGSGTISTPLPLLILLQLILINTVVCHLPTI